MTGTIAGHAQSTAVTRRALRSIGLDTSTGRVCAGGKGRDTAGVALAAALTMARVPWRSHCAEVVHGDKYWCISRGDRNGCSSRGDSGGETLVVVQH